MPFHALTSLYIWMRVIAISLQRPVGSQIVEELRGCVLWHLRCCGDVMLGRGFHDLQGIRTRGRKLSSSGREFSLFEKM